MNENIKALAIQAKNELRANLGLPPETSPEIETFFNERFAQLIVTQCKFILLDMMNNPNRDSDTLDLALTEINETFGIEQ